LSKLAILGGEKTRSEPFPAYNTIGKEEEEAALRVLRSGKLSTFLGTWHEDFYGGSEVQNFEKNWAKYFKVKHAISVNSATSGLFCSVGAIGISPGDEIIVSPYTMSASVMAAIVYGAIPVFADIEENGYCLDPKSVEENITEKTKAIIIVDIFGQPYDVERINKIANENDLYLIEDTAQAPGAKFNDKFAGTLGDIGIFSLNYHKHIHSGEGGVVVTDNDELAEKIKLIRNHAESVLGAKGIDDKSELINMVGFNYRMTEMEAALSNEQLKKLDFLLKERIENVNYLESKIKEIPCIELPMTRKNATHAFYLHAFKFLEKKAGISREKFVDAIKAELPKTILRDDSEVLMGCGYVKPLYLLPMFQERIAFGKDGYPFSLSKRDYKKVNCPIVEKMHFKELVTHELIRPGMTKKDLDDVATAFLKVWENRNELL